MPKPARTPRRAAVRAGHAKSRDAEAVGPRRRRASRIARRLAEIYPDASCALVFRSPWELLVATVLSAQSTDAQVNRITPALFGELPTPGALARAPTARVQALIRPVGMFRRKAEALQRMARQLLDRHDGDVPRSLEGLTQLDGVGRKTANVILGTAYGQPAITVDTHVGRLARRMGLSREREPERVETDLARLLPSAEWTAFCHRMIHHGRQVCAARRPRCGECRLADLCPRIGGVTPAA
jgi:endonuclease-3